MEFIDRNITPQNIHEKISLLKNLVLDLEADMNEHTDLKTQMNIYKSIHFFIPINNRSWNIMIF